MKPAVFVFSNASHYGGAEKSLELMLPALAETFTLTIFAEHKRHVGALTAMRLPGAGIVALPEGNRPAAWRQSIGVARERLAAQKPRLLLTNSNKGAMLAAVLQRIEPAAPPALVYIRDFLWKHRRFILRALRDFEVVVPSAAVTDHPGWRKLLAPHKTNVIANAATCPPEAALETDPGPTILCLANLARWKGIHHLIRAYARLSPRARQNKLVIAGAMNELEYYNLLQRLIAETGLGARIELNSFVDDVAPCYRNAAVVVIPSISQFGGPETFGRTVIEAWAHARPVVAFSTGGPKYLIRDGLDGYLVPEGNEALLARRIEALIENPALAARMGEQGRQRALHEFSVPHIAGQLKSKMLALAAPANHQKNDPALN